VIWAFYDQVVKVEKGWVEQEFVLLIISALPNETGLPNQDSMITKISGTILRFKISFKHS